MTRRIKENHDLPGPHHDPWLEPVDDIPDNEGLFVANCDTCGWTTEAIGRITHDEALDLAAAHSDYYENLEEDPTIEIKHRNGNILLTSDSAVDIRAAVAEAAENNIDLTGADLTNADLSCGTLPNAKLSYANLSYTDFSCANMPNTDFTGADLSYTDFSRTNLTNANFTGANTKGADFTGANLTGTNLNGAPTE